ncbi:MAG: mechanosensitive ion channel family protein [Actinomycetota bacterium]|nr:mechanosensitive ion channel family protein [Actinomycetota bacterium]
MNLDDLSRWGRSDGLQIVLLAIGAVLAARFVHWLAGRFATGASAAGAAAFDAGVPIDERDKRRRAVMQALERAVVGILWFVTVFMILLRLRVPVTSLVAPATVAGVAIGFGAQRVVGDLLSGFFLLSEDQYGVGDVVQIAQPNQLTATGTVEAVSLRTTRLRTSTGELVVIPNGAILQVVNRSRDWARVTVDVPVELEADIDRAAEALREVGAEMAADEEWSGLLLEAPTVTGVESIEVGYANLRVVARTLPAKAPEVSRELRRRAIGAFRTAGFASPAPRS